MAKNVKELVAKMPAERQAKIKSRSRVLIAREFKKQMAALGRRQDRLYIQAIRKLKVADTMTAFDWFYNDQVGFNSFEESLKDASAL